MCDVSLRDSLQNLPEMSRSVTILSFDVTKDCLVGENVGPDEKPSHHHAG